MIIIRDDLPPESNAMLQALYSRSPASVLDHIKKVEASGPEKFMSQYYVGYNHQSIGDCGSTTVFIEDVSMLAAKAIQDWPLYRGQEASTRYMDFAKVRIEDPVGTPGSREIQDAWMAFYHEAQEPLLAHLRERYPYNPGEEKEEVYERAINARKFDILRGFLPAGATTNVAWHTDLRQAQDHLDWLTTHPDPLIRSLSKDILAALRERYSSSFREAKPELAAWRDMVSRHLTYADPVHTDAFVDVRVRNGSMTYHSVDALLNLRPKHAVLPHWMADLGSVRSLFELDFGSFRDLQRHRNGLVRMPLLTTGLGFHPWYLKQMPMALRDKANQLLRVQESRIETLNRMTVPEVVQQYYVSLGYRVHCEVVQSIPAFIYRVELRTQPTVHPTLREVVQAEAQQFKTALVQQGVKVALYDDTSPDSFSLRRGRQTITEKAAG